jgi:hypothetical protein
MAPTVLRHAPADSTTDTIVTLLRELVGGQQRIIALLERDRPARQPAHDDALMLALGAAVADRAFSARELTQHAALVDGDLRAALDAAGLVSARRLGKFFRTIEGQTIAGLRLDRIGTDNQGVIWRVSRVSNTHTHTAYGLDADSRP